MAKKKKQEEIIASDIPAQILQKAIGDITEDAYVRFGGYVNNSRAIPSLLGGFKISWLRLLHSALSFPISKDIPTATLISKMGETHPHSLTGVEGTVRVFVRSGIFEGDGNFGRTYIDGSEAPPASPRYTKIRISDTYAKVLGDLTKEVPWIESPVGPLEPSYIPVPVPQCLFLSEKVTGLGVGIKSDMPNFSARSLYNAYMANDPQLLEPNIDVILDKGRSDLEGLWRNGKGKITYSYRLQRQRSDDGKTEGVLFYGDTGIFTVSFKKFQKLLEENKVTIDNVSDQTGTKLLISRVPGARGITIEDIENICTKICYDTTTYTLNVTNGATSFRIPLFDWIDYNYKNYIGLVKRVNDKRVAQVQFEIRTQQALPVVVDYILTKNPGASNEEITAALGIEAEVISAVMSKPIGYLRKNRDTANRIKELEKKLKELKSFDPVRFTYNVIQEL